MLVHHTFLQILGKHFWGKSKHSEEYSKTELVFEEKKCLRYTKFDPERERDYEVKTFLCVVVVDLSSFCTFASSTTRKNSAISFSDTPFSFTNSDKMASNFAVVELSASFSTNSNKMVSKFEVDVDSAVTNTSSLLQVNLCQKLFFLQNMGRTCCVQKLF